MLWSKAYTAHPPYVKSPEADQELDKYCSQQDGDSDGGGSEPEPTSGNLSTGELQRAWEDMEAENRRAARRQRGEQARGEKEVPHRMKRLSQKERGWCRSTHPRLNPNPEPPPLIQSQPQQLGRDVDPDAGQDPSYHHRTLRPVL